MRFVSNCIGFNAVPAVREWLARGAPLPAFGHPLYPWRSTRDVKRCSRPNCWSCWAGRTGIYEGEAYPFIAGENFLLAWLTSANRTGMGN